MSSQRDSLFLFVLFFHYLDDFGLNLLNLINCCTIQFINTQYDFLITVKAAPHECVIRTGQP